MELNPCRIPLVLKDIKVAECYREKGHKGRHKGFATQPIYTEFEWTLKKKRDHETN